MLTAINAGTGVGDMETAVQPDSDRLKKACMDFESIFINEMLKNADRSSFGDHGLLKGNDGKIIKSMFNQTLAETLTTGDGMGLGHLLFEKLNKDAQENTGQENGAS
jgi:peptidoglycan hydrolase FlgJ